jgi:hypothetical protein
MGVSRKAIKTGRAAARVYARHDKISLLDSMGKLRIQPGKTALRQILVCREHTFLCPLVQVMQVAYIPIGINIIAENPCGSLKPPCECD